MNKPNFDSIVNSQLDMCKDILVDRAKQYATGDERLHNFVVAADMLGCTKAQAALGMAAKHFVSVFDIVAERVPCSSAMLDEKITDAINYLLLIKACMIEQQGFEALT